MKFDLTILGCGAATPTLRRNPTSQLVNVHDKLFLIDCAEGTQIQLRKYKVKFQRIHHIFISHLHGDHYLGLVGLISSMHLLGRVKVLHVYSPPGLKELVTLNLRLSDTRLNFEVVFHETNNKEMELLYEDNTLSVHSFPLKHRIHTTGFLFTEKVRKPKIKKEYIEEYQLTINQIRSLKNEEDVQLDNGELIPYQHATVQQSAPKNYAFCSDTIYLPELRGILPDVNLLYHESTFLEEHKTRAKETFHSTASQAAMIASQLNAKQLILGHYSSRYTDLSKFLKEAQNHFKNVTLAEDGLMVAVPE